VESACRKFVRNREVSGEEIDVGIRPAIIEQVKQSKFICSACGSGRDCDCNAPARLRAVEAVKANPEKSNRSIAAATGLSEAMVRRARSTASDDAVERTGLDGKVRKLPKHKPVVEPDEIEVLTTLQTQPIIVNLSHPAETLARVIFENCGAAKSGEVAKELNHLIESGGNERHAANGNSVDADASVETIKAQHEALNIPADLSIPDCLRRMR
jgi:hypothetical protein